MKLLVDANIPVQIVHRLRELGHDVSYAADQTPGAPDELWLEEARLDSRTLITSDKDFGELVFRRGLMAGSVVLLRLYDLPIAVPIAWDEQKWRTILSQAEKAFVVVTEHKIRVRRLP